MRRSFIALLLAAAIALPPSALAQQAAAAQTRPAESHEKIQYPPLNDIQVPEPERYVLPNGMTVFLLEDHELPLVYASATIRVGDRWEPAEKVGLAEIAAEVTRTGGTPTRGGDDLDDELDRLAMSVETGAGSGSGSASMSALRDDAERGLTILADVLRNPAFPEDKIQLAQLQAQDGISRRNDNPMGIHSRELSRLIYGKNSPYGRLTEYDTVGSITRDDLVAWHKQYYQPENVILGVWGDFDAAGMKATIEKTLGGWPKGGNPRPATPPVDRSAARAGVYFIPKDDVNQSSVAMALLLGQQNDPDYYALSVMTSVLGGGFKSRLFSKVRTEMGLAYSAGSSYAAGYDLPGVWSARVMTKSESTVEATQAVKAELARIAAEEITDQELQLAKDAILKGAAFDFDSTSKIVGRLMTYEYYGYPANFLDQYRANVQNITKADVLRVAKKYLDTDQYVLLVLGRAADFDRPLSTLGEVTEVDVTIPPPSSPPSRGPGAQ